VELENQYGYSMTSTSNEVCLQQEPKVWIPNAFMVNGNNTSFYPVISFADFDTFSMIIYSRWGDIIHNTDDIDDPWRGKKGGVLVPEGGYAYYIAIKDGRGQQHEYRGTVHLLIGAIE
jgi:gliding motility-associated-like protein